MPVSNFSNLTINPRFTNILEINEILEGLVDIAPASNTFSFDYNVGSVFYSTSTTTANYTINLTNAPTINGRVFSINHIHPQGATGYRPTTLNINGGAVTIKWVGGTAPTPTSSAGKIDIFTFTIIRRSGAFDAIGSANLNI